MLYHTNGFRQIPVPPALLDEMEALYAPPKHPIFTLVPTAFHEHMMQLYLSIGEPTVTVRTFRDIYCNLLKDCKNQQMIK